MDAEVLFGWNHWSPRDLPMDGAYRGVSRCPHGQAFLLTECGPSNFMVRLITEDVVEAEREVADAARREAGRAA